MKRLTPAEQLVVLDSVMLVIGKLRDHAAASGNASAAQRLDDEHSAADESRHTLLWSIEADEQQAYASLAKALKNASKPEAGAKQSASKKPAVKKAMPRKGGRASTSGTRVRSR